MAATRWLSLTEYKQSEKHRKINDRSGKELPSCDIRPVKSKTRTVTKKDQSGLSLQDPKMAGIRSSLTVISGFPAPVASVSLVSSGNRA
jgi:hypothetical protein